MNRDEKGCEAVAHKAITEYVNGLNCASPAEISLALQKLVALALAALNLVENGKMEKAQ